MGLLITGGLLVVALLAIIGSIFVARSGATDNARKRPEKAAAPEATGSDSESRVETPPVETFEQPEEPSLPPTVAAPLEEGQTNNEHIETTMSLDNEQPAYSANGQVHELTTQLQALHEETQRLSQRLSALTEMAEHIEERQTGHLEDGV